MKKIFTLLIFLLQTTFAFSQSIHYIINYKHKVYSISPFEDENLCAQNYIMEKAFLYSKRFYSLNKLPNIYILNYFSGNINPSISFDMVEGWILQRRGKEGDIPEYKCGLRIECTNSLDSTFRLLDYGINNLVQIKAFQDSILALPNGNLPANPKISEYEIKKALSTKLSLRKEAYIRRIIKDYNKRFEGINIIVP